jgi:hypothetical protein
VRRAGDGDVELTDAVDGAGAQWRGRCCSDVSGRTPGARWCSSTCNTGRRDGEPCYPRWPRPQKIGATAVCLSERTGGREHGQHARWRAPFIAVHRVRLMRSCGGDGMGRMTHRIVQRQLGSCVEGTRGVFCLYVIGEVSWKGRGEPMRPHGAHGHANARYLGVRKGRLRLGLNSVHRHTRREEAAALPKTCLPAPCPWHRGLRNGSVCVMVPTRKGVRLTRGVHEALGPAWQRLGGGKWRGPVWRNGLG